MANHNSNSLSARASHWRGWVQTAFLAVWMTPYLKLHSVCGPVFHCYACPLSTFACPIGVLANFSALHVIPFLAIGTLLVVGGVIGSFVCGWACPFGFFQDLMGKIPTPRFHLPRWSGHLRYVTLGLLVLAVPFLYGESHPLFFCRLCPAGAMEGAYTGMVQAAVAKEAVVWPSTAKTTIFILFLAATLFVNRPWCGLFCPLGAIYGLSNRVSAFYLKVSGAGCTRCGLCAQTCRYGVVPWQQSSDSRCIRCLECSGCDAVTAASVFGDSSVAEPTPLPAVESEAGKTTRA